MNEIRKYCCSASYSYFDAMKGIRYQPPFPFAWQSSKLGSYPHSEQTPVALFAQLNTNIEPGFLYEPSTDHVAL